METSFDEIEAAAGLRVGKTSALSMNGYRIMAGFGITLEPNDCYISSIL